MIQAKKNALNSLVEKKLLGMACFCTHAAMHAQQGDNATAAM